MDSVSPADNLSGGDVTPDLMIVSPLSGQEQESQGPASQGPAPMGGTSSMDALLHEREQLHSQTLQLKSHIHCLEADSSSVIDQMPPNELLKLYESLKEEYLQKTVAIDSQELLIRGEHLNEILLSIYNTADTDHDLQAQKRRVDDLQEEMRSLVAKIGTAQKQKAQMQNSLEKIKKENTELLRQSRELYERIGERRQQQEEELKALTRQHTNVSVYDRLDEEVQQATLINGTIQRLILGSRIDWVRDDQLRKLMLDCGKPVNLGT